MWPIEKFSINSNNKEREKDQHHHYRNPSGVIISSDQVWKTVVWERDGMKIKGACDKSIL